MKWDIALSRLICHGIRSREFEVYQRETTNVIKRCPEPGGIDPCPLVFRRWQRVAPRDAVRHSRSG